MGLSICGMARSHRDNPLFLTFNALTCAFALRWVGLLAEDQAEKTATAAIFIYLVPLVGIATAIWFIAKNRTLISRTHGGLSTELVFEKLAQGFKRLMDAAKSVLPRRKGPAS
jgi:hypothetical protein